MQRIAVPAERIEIKQGLTGTWETVRLCSGIQYRYFLAEDGTLTWELESKSNASLPFSRERRASGIVAASNWRWKRLSKFRVIPKAKLRLGGSK